MAGPMTTETTMLPGPGHVAVGGKSRYSHRHHEGAPEDMPEIARELTILTGAADTVRVKAVHVEEQLEALVVKLGPVSDRSERPSPGAVSEDIARVETMVPITEVGTEIRQIAASLGETTEHLERLGTRLWALTRDIAL